MQPRFKVPSYDLNTIQFNMNAKKIQNEYEMPEKRQTFRFIRTFSRSKR